MHATSHDSEVRRFDPVKLRRRIRAETSESELRYVRSLSVGRHSNNPMLYGQGLAGTLFRASRFLQAL